MTETELEKLATTAPTEELRDLTLLVGKLILTKEERDSVIKIAYQMGVESGRYKSIKDMVRHTGLPPWELEKVLKDDSHG